MHEAIPRGGGVGWDEFGVGDFRGECGDRAATTKWRFTVGFREVRIR